MYAKHLFSRGSIPPDLRRFSLADARGRDRAARSLRRTLSALRRNDAPPAATHLLTCATHGADEGIKTALRVEYSGPDRLIWNFRRLMRRLRLKTVFSYSLGQPVNVEISGNGD